MNISDKGIALIKEFESLRLRAYRDPAGVWTIGWGHTGTAKAGMSITKAEAEDLLRQDLQWAVDAVNRMVKVPLSQGQFDALVSFVFNVGAGDFQGSTLLRMLNQGRYGAVPSQLARWDKATVEGQLIQLAGLARRRAAEAALWTSDEGIQETRVRPAPQRDRKLKDTRTGQGIGVTTIGALGQMLVESGRDLGVLTGDSTVLTIACFMVMAAGIGISVWGAMRRINAEGD